MLIHSSSCSFCFFFILKLIMSFLFLLLDSGISFNSFTLFLFFHRCSDKRQIFFMSGTYVCQQNSPVLQLMIGFCSCNQGKPRIIFCFLSPVRNSRWVWDFPLIVNDTSTYCLIVPHLFSVPSTLSAFIGF